MVFMTTRTESTAMTDQPASAPATTGATPTTTYLGFLHDDLRAAFSRIASKENWKNPVEAEIVEGDFKLMSAAVVFMTGSILEVVENLEGGRLRVWAAGYYLTIGA